MSNAARQHAHRLPKVLHPAGLLDAYLDGQFPQLFRALPAASRSKSLSRDEQILAHFLRRWPQLSRP